MEVQLYSGIHEFLSFAEALKSVYLFIEKAKMSINL